jgi:ribosomal protein L3 glutamine methyltransferase
LTLNDSNHHAATKNLYRYPEFMQVPDNLITIRDMVRWGASQFRSAQLFFGHGTDNALDEALALVLHCLSLEHSLPESYFNSRLTSAEIKKISELIGERIRTRKPLAYLTGAAWFAGIEFHVNEHVLVPRSPIAELIEQGYYPWLQPDRIQRVLDLCTGSGCIGIATALYLPESAVTLIDISTEALLVAQQNIKRYELADRVTVLESDIYNSLPPQQFDLIVSNPPYVSENEYAGLPDEYRREPKLGLTAEEDGMALVARILRQATDYLTPEGVIIVEVGASADILMQRYPEVPFQWIDFEQGGDGVFMLNHADLKQYQSVF